MELKISGLTKQYGTKEALKGIDLMLSPGIYGLLGPNGAGKSTLMNILVGNLSPTSGAIYFNKENIQYLNADFRKRIGYMPQQQAFYPGFTVEQYLFYFASLHGMTKAKAIDRIQWVLSLLALSDVRKKQIRTLSGGMKQRLLLAQSIVHDPDILVLDEPTAGLDPMQRIAVRNLIGQIAMDKIVIISTHVISDVEFIAKDLILLSHGEILCRETPHILLQQLEGKIWNVIVRDHDVDSVRDMGIICGMARDAEGIRVRLLSDQCPSVPCEQGQPCLEDVYLHYFGEVSL